MQMSMDVAKRVPGRISSSVGRFSGSRAVAGAVARMSSSSNRLRGLHQAMSPVGFGQWSDWDNGHTDG